MNKLLLVFCSDMAVINVWWLLGAETPKRWAKGKANFEVVDQPFARGNKMKQFRFVKLTVKV